MIKISSKDASIAVVHEWLSTYAGSERLVEQFLFLYPQAHLFTLVDFLKEDERDFLYGKKSNTSFLQKLPCASRYFRHYLPLMPFAIEQFDLSDYDVIISSHHAVAKGVLTSPQQLHICYIHTPMRYAWDLHHQYLKEEKLNWGLKALLVRLTLHYIRMWDALSANNVDIFVANSNYVAKRVQQYYGREAKVIYPPVDIEKFPLQELKQDFYVTASRMVPYKKIDLIVEAFGEMPDKKLIVIGDGPNAAKIKAKAGLNIQFVGHAPFPVLLDYFQKAKAFVFAAEEDFGITPVEAQACGTPVIAYGKGGCLETIQGLETPSPTGVFFSQQSVSSLIKAVTVFEENSSLFSPQACRENAMRFSIQRFRQEFNDLVQEALASF